MQDVISYPCPKGQKLTGFTLNKGLKLNSSMLFQIRWVLQRVRQASWPQGKQLHQNGFLLIFSIAVSLYKSKCQLEEHLLAHILSRCCDYWKAKVSAQKYLYVKGIEMEETTEGQNIQVQSNGWRLKSLGWIKRGVIRDALSTSKHCNHSTTELPSTSFSPSINYGKPQESFSEQ